MVRWILGALSSLLLGACLCAPGTSKCDGQCVDTATSNAHCGACGNACPATLSCRDGRCQPPSGSCVPDCGANAHCQAGSCVCDAGVTRCGSTCVDLQNDARSCGSCGLACGMGAQCERGFCRCTDASQTVCGGACVNLTSAHDDCGACGHACPAEATCTAGACVCPGAGGIECDGTCVDGSTDAANCGACGTACTLQCMNGACEAIDDVSIGGSHMLVRMTSGVMWSWGYDASCQLGDGECVTRSQPAARYPITGITQISAGVNYSCAVAGGRAYCWGDDEYGQLGNGTTAFAYRNAGRVPTSGVVSRVAAGDDATCALLSDRTVYCWGRADEGIVESPGLDPVTVPVRWGSLDDVVELEVGGSAVCVRREGGEVHCSRFGNVGGWPPERAEWFGATDIDVGGGHACAILDGAVSCFGRNGSGQLGDGTVDSGFGLDGPTTVELPEPAVELALYGFGTCARVSSGRVYCWGDSANGVTGPLAPSPATTPRAIPSTVGSQRLFCGLGNCCVWFGGADLRCWGDDYNGQLGDGRGHADRDTPYPIRWQ